MKRIYLLLVFLSSSTLMLSQTLYVPNASTNGIANSANGNVGIGTLTPSAKLDIEGGDLHIGNEVSANGQRRQIRIYGYDSNSQFYGSIHANWEESKRTFDIYTDSATQQLKIDASANAGGQILLLPGISANVGIGTTTPSAKLDIEGGDLHIGNEVSNNGQRRQIRVYGYDSNSQFYGSIHANWEESKRTFDIYTNSATHQLKIDASANTGGQILLLPGASAGVGIGTTSPDAKLAVNGDVHAKEVKVDLTGWPDYIFHKNYPLPTLEDVETHIKANGHLKDIPSEAEVKANGINLGEMDAKLLQKIEELTLYTIAQDKTLKAQQKEIETLKKENEALEALSKEVLALKAIVETLKTEN